MPRDEPRKEEPSEGQVAKQRRKRQIAQHFSGLEHQPVMSVSDEKRTVGM